MGPDQPVAAGQLDHDHPHQRRLVDGESASPILGEQAVQPELGLVRGQVSPVDDPPRQFDARQHLLNPRAIRVLDESGAQDAVPPDGSFPAPAQLLVVGAGREVEDALFHVDAAAPGRLGGVEHGFLHRGQPMAGAGLGRLVRRLGPGQFSEQVQAAQRDGLGELHSGFSPGMTQPDHQLAVAEAGDHIEGVRAERLRMSGRTRRRAARVHEAGAGHDAGVQPAQIVDRDLGRRLLPERIAPPGRPPVAASAPRRTRGHAAACRGGRRRSRSEPRRWAHQPGPPPGAAW